MNRFTDAARKASRKVSGECPECGHGMEHHYRVQDADRHTAGIRCQGDGRDPADCDCYVPAQYTSRVYTQRELDALLEAILDRMAFDHDADPDNIVRAEFAKLGVKS